MKRTACISSIALLLAWQAAAQPAAPELHPHDDIARTATEFALAQLDAGEYLDVSATAQSMDERLRLRQCSQPLEASSTVGTVKPGRVAVSVRCTGEAPWSLFVPVTITARAPVVVLKGPLQRGKVLTSADLELRELPVDTLPPQYLSRAEDVIGSELTRNVNNESYATASMLRLRKLVEKGQSVVILAQSGQLAVKMAGVAQEAGQLGDRIGVLNTASGRTVYGQVDESGSVVVSL